MWSKGWFSKRKEGIRQVSDEEVDGLRKDCWHWFEGVTLIGYWETGDSYLFAPPRGDGEYVVCVSGNYMRRAIQHAKEKGGDETPFDPQPEG